MRLDDFNYNLPSDLIAQVPTKPRDHCRLLVLDKKSGKIQHQHFFDLPKFLRAGDLLVVNNSKVIKARLIGHKPTGGQVEVFLVKKTTTNMSRYCRDATSCVSVMNRQTKKTQDIASLQNTNKNEEIWQCLIRGKTKTGMIVKFAKNLQAEILENHDQTWQVKFNKQGLAFMKIVEQIGQVPLPPYIKRAKQLSSDQKNYQTIYAKNFGSVASPTAGLHFTKSLYKKLEQQGVKIVEITLHVGLGTFLPVKNNDITKHQMHSEWYEIKPSVYKKIVQTKNNGGRVIAVGTTSARTLETIFMSRHSLPLGGCADAPLSGLSAVAPTGAKEGWTNIFIYPPYKFKIVDGLITNFHLPKSTLLILVSALAGRQRLLNAYQEAIKHGYKFYSYGDAMFIV